MDQEIWDNILAQINAPKSGWRLLSRELLNTTKEFESGNGVTQEEVRKLRETWQSDRPFVDASGHPFVLFIYDQSLAYRSGYYHSSNQHSSYKFHFSWCSTLEAMDSGGRRARYKAKHDVDNNIFSVHRGERNKDEKIPMEVCINCLKNMNYESYTSVYSQRGSIYKNFNIAVFFAKYGPQNLKNPTHQYHAGGYTEDWSTISSRLKEKKNYTCEKCGHKKPGRLDVHHKNGVKSDNSLANLMVLCLDCHTNEPFHAHMRNLNHQNR